MFRRPARRHLPVLTLFGILLIHMPVPGQCVPEMNDIREEIRNIQVTALNALHRKATLAAGGGWRAIDKGKRSKATRLFHDAIRRNPDCWHALAGLAHLSFLEGNTIEGIQWYRSSREAFQRFRKHAPRLAAQLRDCRNRLTVVMKRLDRHESMYSIQEKGESYDPSHQEQVVLTMRDWLSNELKTLEQRIRQGYPAHLLMVIGADMARAGMWTAAESAYREALATDPDNGILHTNLAVCLLARGKLEEAKIHAKQAASLGVQLNPELAEKLGITICEQKH